MWVEKSANTRASRVAIAGSIYMRRASLQANKPKQINNENMESTMRAPSYGKIVKNYSKKTDHPLPEEIPHYSRRVASPLLDRNDFISPRLGAEFSRKTPTPSFGNFDTYENSKVKAIQQKYRAMLSDYEIKKKSINSQLASLKNSTPSATNIKAKENQIKTGIIASKNIQRGSQNILKEYQAKSKQLVIEKIGGGIKATPSKKKQKLSNMYPNFFKAIKNQILLEEELRVLKSTISADKKQEIEKILLENQQSKYLKLLDLDPEEYDPFENKKPSEMSPTAQATKLIQKHKECEQNWKEAVCSLSRKEARQIFQSLNFEKVQQISLKSFVRQMSFLLQKHLRNRDMLRIFNRLAPLTHHNFCLVVSNRE